MLLITGDYTRFSHFWRQVAELLATNLASFGAGRLLLRIDSETFRAAPLRIPSERRRSNKSSSLFFLAILPSSTVLPGPSFTAGLAVAQNAESGRLVRRRLPPGSSGRLRLGADSFQGLAPFSATIAGAGPSSELDPARRARQVVIQIDSQKPALDHGVMYPFPCGYSD